MKQELKTLNALSRRFTQNAFGLDRELSRAERDEQLAHNVATLHRFGRRVGGRRVRVAK